MGCQKEMQGEQGPRTWIFSLRRWGGTEEFKQENNVECVSMCMYMYIYHV